MRPIWRVTNAARLWRLEPLFTTHRTMSRSRLLLAVESGKGQGERGYSVRRTRCERLAARD
jgi:hypothetical protein